MNGVIRDGQQAGKAVVTGKTGAVGVRPASVTVVIPVYNGEEFVERTVRSAAGQTYPELRILAVNDGSTDGTEAILARLAAEVVNFSYVTTPNGGVARARNTGTEMADSTYVAYLDADDLWHPTKIAKQVAALESHDDPAWAACYAFSRDIDRECRVFGKGKPPLPARGSFFSEHLVKNHVGNGSSLLVRRDAALQIGGFEPSYAESGAGGCEDRDFQLRILSRFKMDVVEEYLVGYRRYPGNMSSSHGAMARAQIAVIEAFVSDPRITPLVRRAALANAHRYATRKFARSGEWRNAASSLIVHLRTEPVEAVWNTVGVAGRILSNIVTQRFNVIPNFRKGINEGANFYDFDPKYHSDKNRISHRCQQNTLRNKSTST